MRKNHLYRYAGLFGFLSCLLISSCRKEDSDKKDLPKLQDSDRRDVDASLKQAYQDKQIIYLAHTDHGARSYFAILERMIDLFGDDPNLVGIVLERQYDSQDLYDEVLLDGIEPSLSRAERFVEENKPIEGIRATQEVRQQALNYYNTICISPEWQYSLTNLSEKVRAKNRERQVPLRYFTVDGWSKTKKLHWPMFVLDDKKKRVQNQEPGCDDFKVGSWVSSVNRERRTAEEFGKVYQNLLPHQKLIVVYHLGHLITNTDQCWAEIDENHRIFHRRLTGGSWRDLFQQSFPEAKEKSSVVYVDTPSHTLDKRRTQASISFLEAFVPSDRDLEFALDKNTLKRFGDYPFSDLITRESEFHKTKQTFKRQSNDSIADQVDTLIYRPLTFPQDVFFAYDYRKPKEKWIEVCQQIPKIAESDVLDCRSDFCPGDGSP